MGARTNRANHFFRLSGRKNEFDMLRRLFHDFEQRIEPARRHHVCLVENKDFVSVSGRRKDRALSQIARILNATVACGVDLYNIHRSAAVAAQFYATRTHTTRGVGRALGAVQAPSKNASGCCFATPARTTKQIGVVHAVIAQCGTQRVGHLRLTNKLSKSLGPITAI